MTSNHIARPVTWFDPGHLTDGYIPYKDALNLEDSGLYWDDTLTRLGVNMSTNLQSTLNVKDTMYVEMNITGTATDGWYVQKSSHGFVAAFGFALPELKSDLLSGASNVAAIRSSLFIAQNSSDAVSDVPTVYMTDDLGNNTAYLRFNPSTGNMNFGGSNFLSFDAPAPSTFGTGAGNTHSNDASITAKSSSTDPTVHGIVIVNGLDNNINYDGTILFVNNYEIATVRQYTEVITGVDSSDGGYKIAISDALGTNDAFIVAQNKTVQTTSGRRAGTTRITNTDSPYTVLATDHKIFADTDGGAITINLPAGIAGTTYKITNTGNSGNNITLSPNGTELLHGVNASEFLIDAESLDLTYDTTEGWW